MVGIHDKKRCHSAANFSSTPGTKIGSVPLLRIARHKLLVSKQRMTASIELAQTTPDAMSSSSSQPEPGGQEEPTTIPTLLASEALLLRQASEAIPFQFNACTYSLGHIRQAVYLCLTCNVQRGVCAPCSVACHTDHEQVELFPKRGFRCDCPTAAMAGAVHPCALKKKRKGGEGPEEPEPENVGNTYGQNFRGDFCRCGRPYDAKKERETMIQCLACEVRLAQRPRTNSITNFCASFLQDWFHESCLNLRERPPSRAPTPEAPNAAEVSDSNASNGTSNANDAEGNEDDDLTSTSSDPDLPPPLIHATEYDSLICRDCVLRNATLRRWAGTRGAKMVVSSYATEGLVRQDGAGAAKWSVIGDASDADDDEMLDVGAETNGNHVSKADTVPSSSGSTGSKRRQEDDQTTSTSEKRPRLLSPSPTSKPLAGSDYASQCLAPSQDPVATRVVSAISSTPPDHSLGAGDIFLTEGWRDRWCRCSQVSVLFLQSCSLLNDDLLFNILLITYLTV